VEHAPPWQNFSLPLCCCPVGQLAESIAAHVSPQHSEAAAAAAPLNIWPSDCGRAFFPAGHSYDPLASPWLRQPDAQHCTWQQSAWSHTPLEHMLPSLMPRALLEAGHCLVPLPKSRQPDSQHCALQQVFAKHVPPLQVAQVSVWLRATCPVGHKNVPAAAGRWVAAEGAAARRGRGGDWA